MRKRMSLLTIAGIAAGLILGSADAGVAGSGIRSHAASTVLGRSRAAPTTQCSVSVPDNTTQVQLRCRGDGGSTRAVFVINVGDHDVYDVERTTTDRSHCPNEILTWRYRAATRSVKVVYEVGGGRFRCELLWLTERIDI